MKDVANDLQAMFERRAAWQRSRAGLPWAEKLRLSIVMRKAHLALRQSFEDRKQRVNG